jgi:hypothetical protein
MLNQLKIIKMRKLTLYIMTAFLSLTFIPAQLKAGTEATTASTTNAKTSEAAEANALINRLNDINGMDKSKLSSSEKKELRMEVRATKKHLKELNGGVYLSVGAIILIVILLIILL